MAGWDQKESRDAGLKEPTLDLNYVGNTLCIVICLLDLQIR